MRSGSKKVCTHPGILVFNYIVMRGCDNHAGDLFDSPEENEMNPSAFRGNLIKSSIYPFHSKSSPFFEALSMAGATVYKPRNCMDHFMKQGCF